MFFADAGRSVNRSLQIIQAETLIAFQTQLHRLRAGIRAISCLLATGCCSTVDSVFSYREEKAA
ncbi:unnamed protein product [Rhodiola kirilowii]